MLKVGRSHLHGYGCFTQDAVQSGDIVGQARILIFPPDEMRLLFATGLKHYLFHLKDGPTVGGPFYTALAIGPMSFCNHSDDANCDFRLDEDAGEIILVARRRLEPDEEVTIDYGDYAEEII